MSRLNIVAGIAALSLLAPSPIEAQSAGDQQLGNVHFATTCNETAQRRFDRAIRYQHSFWYRASREVFEEAAKADPECGIAYWGLALGYLDNPHGPIPGPNVAPGLAAIQKAKAVGARSERERDYIDALSVMYVDADKLTHTQRIRAYLQAMEKLAAKYADDDEAQIAYAITLNTSASPGDKTYAQQLKGAAILVPIWKRQPQHPGVAHYLIHLYDYPAIADKGLVAANEYAKIAPAAPHAQHMPSHIFTRVGYWKESIDSNAASVKAAKADKEYGDQLHGQDYQVYAYLQLGRDKEARGVVDDIGVTTVNPANRGGAFAHAASPARYMIERGDWNGAAGLQLQPSRFGYVDAITHFARALGAARSGNLAGAHRDIAQLAELRERLRQANDGYWSEQVHIQWQVATAWLLNAESKHADALNAMSAAANLEDQTEKSIVTPGPLVPAREFYGAMLLERGLAKEALAAFEATLTKEPNRLGAMIGAAQAAERLGDAAMARLYYAAVLSLAGGANTSRAAVAYARAFTTKN